MGKRIFKRKIYQDILRWKNENNGKSALLIEGARRIGKSTIVEEFARNEYDSYIIIDFNKVSNDIKSMFDDLMDLDFLFLRLQQAFHKTLTQRKSVIIFDEVQNCPLARQAIKYLVQDGRYDYIETGSLISIKKHTKDITIPSEEDRLQMHPLDYEEFRWTLGDTATIPLLEKFWEKKAPLGAAHRNVARDFRLYMLVGGMPQAVNEYLDTNNMQKVDEVKRKIIRLYEDDFLKIDPSGRASKIFMSIPSALSRNANRYVPFSVLGKVEEDKLTEILKSVEDSKTVNFAFHADDPNVGMPLNSNFDKFKLFIADIGLFITLAFWDKDYTENIIYEKLLNNKLSANLGYVYENLIAQMLIAKGNRLFYHTWQRDEKHYYEIDFLLSKNNKICPIEVKSSGYSTHKSLDEFYKKYSNRILWKYLIYTKDLAKDADTILVPTYMTSLL
nr:AAA family ATPase [uncultured Bacteroides sp.]